VHDWVCLSNQADSCVQDMEWVNARTNPTGSWLGTVGLCANPSGKTGNSDPVAESYVKQLNASSLTTSEIFALGFRNAASSESSFMDFGFANEAAMEDPSSIVYVDNYNAGDADGDYYWSQQLTGIRFRDSSLDYDSSVAQATVKKGFNAKA